MIAHLTVQPSASTFIHNAILLIDTSNNTWYSHVHWLIGTPYLLWIASNVNVAEYLFSNKISLGVNRPKSYGDELSMKADGLARSEEGVRLLLMSLIWVYLPIFKPIRYFSLNP